MLTGIFIYCNNIALMIYNCINQFSLIQLNQHQIIMTPKSSSLISLNNAGIFRSDRWLVRGVSFNLEPGEILTLIGPNGSGKSTTASNVVDGMREAADVLPQGEKRNNLYMTSNILEAIGKASETPKRQTRRITKDMSDKDLLDGLKTLQIVNMETRNAAYDKLNYKAQEIYANFSNMLDTGDSTSLSYTDLKRMLFLMSDKLNRGGLMVKK